MTTIEKEEVDIQTECWTCIHKANVPGNCHIQCMDPDPDMTGYPHGIKMGWFIYPRLFDPVWKTKACSNYVKRIEEI